MRPLYRYRFGSTQFDEARAQLWVQGQPVRLAPKPRRLLSLLLAAAGRAVGRDELLDLAWGYTSAAADHSLTAAIDRLRRALGPDGERVVTVHGQGYRLDAVAERELVAEAEESALALAPEQPAPHRPAWRLQRQLGSSDGVEVWLVRRVDSGERRVFKLTSQRERMRELRREARLAALVARKLGARPDLVQVLGTEFSAPPFVLEMAFHGENLQQWAQAPGTLDALSRPQRLALFAEIAAAVSALHGVPLVHADLKPSNILVSARADGGWQPCIGDFGSSRLDSLELRRALEAAQDSVALQGDALADPTRGSFMYLAPEVWQGAPPTARSDVFSLGVILFQLLVGDPARRPDAGWERDIGDALLVQDLRQALDGDPARRFASVDEMLAALDRLPQRRDEAARLERLSERLQRAEERRRRLLAGLAALAVGLGVAAVALVDARRSRDALAAEVAKVRALNRFLEERFIAAANPGDAGRADVTVAEAATAAASAIDASFEPSLRAPLHAAMQRALLGQSRHAEALEEGRRALQALRAAGSDQDADAIRIDMAASLIDLARLDEAAAALDAATLAAGGSATTAVQARYWLERAQLAQHRFQSDAAIQAYDQAWVLAQSDASLPPPTREQIALGRADANRMAGRIEPAERQFRDLLAEQRARYGERHPRTCFTAMALAYTLGYADRAEEGIGLIRATIPCLEATLGHDNPRVARGYDVLATLLFQHLEFDAAAQAWRTYCERVGGRLPPTHLRLLTAHGNIALALNRAGRPREAERELRTTLATARREPDLPQPVVQSLRYRLAELLLDRRETAGVAALLDGLDAGQLNATSLAPDWPARLQFQQGRLALFSGRPRAAVPLLEQARAGLSTEGDSGPVTPEAAARLLAQARRAAHRPS